MLGAAPRQARACTAAATRSSTRLKIAAGVAVACVAGVHAGVRPTASAAASHQAHASSVASPRLAAHSVDAHRLWAVQVSFGRHGWFDRTVLKELRGAGVNALVVDVRALGTSPTGWRPLASARTIARAERMSLIVVVPGGRPRSAAAAYALTICSGHSKGFKCAVRASSLDSAKELARGTDGLRSLVAVTIPGPRAWTKAISLGGARRHILVIAPLYSHFNSAAWSSAIGNAVSSPTADMVVAPRGRPATSSVRHFGKMLANGSKVPASVTSDDFPPLVPVPPDQNQVPPAPVVQIAATTATSVALSWAPSATTGVITYDVYVNDVLVQSSPLVAVTIGNLSCGATYTFSVGAADAAGNRSARTNVSAATGACGGGGGSSVPSTPTSSGASSTSAASGSSSTASSTSPPTASVVDSTPPTAPSSVSVGSVGQTSVSLSWSASSDNVAVVGYTALLAGAAVGTTTATSYTFSGLTCATNYVLSVAAQDAAGNTSSSSAISVATSACPSSGSSSGGGASADAANLWVASSGGSASCVRSSVALSFAAALAAGSVCDSGPSAYQAAQLGDTVLVAGGTYTSPWNFSPSISKSGPAGTCDYNYPGPPNLSNCITFKPTSGQTVTFAVPGPGIQVYVCANFVALDGLTFTDETFTETSTGDVISKQAVGVGKGDSSCLPGGAAGHDVYLHNLTVGGHVGIVGGVSNVWVVGGTATGTHDIPWQFGGGGRSVADCVNNSGIVGVTFQGFNFQNHSYRSHHMSLIHTTSCSASTPNHDLYFAGNRFQGGYAEWGTPESLEINGSFRNVTIENNYFDGAPKLLLEPQGGTNVAAADSTVRFNTFNGTVFNAANTCSSPCAASDSGNTAYGNLYKTTYGCPGGALPGWTYSSNVYSQSRQSCRVHEPGGLYGRAIAFASPGPPDFDLRPISSAPAVGISDQFARPKRDIYGNVRPARTAAAAGAAQGETATLVVGRSIGAATLGMSPSEIARAYALAPAPSLSPRAKSTIYRPTRRNLWLTLERGVVVAIRTTSPYYTTAAGLGVGSSATDASRAGFRWHSRCPKAYVRRLGTVSTLLIPEHQAEGGRIASVVIVRGHPARCA